MLSFIARKFNNQKWEDFMNKGKLFQISQELVLTASKRVKENKGASGVDGISLDEYEKS